MNPQDPNLPPPAQAAPPAEDAGSQALAEALRSSFVIVQVVMVALVLVFLGSGFFTVGPEEQAIILRMGKPVGGGRLLNPGAHWAWPAPIDEVVKLHITSLTNADSSVGWYETPEERARRTPDAPLPAALSKLSPANNTYALSADTNIIHVRAVAQYRITEPLVFHFGFSDAPVLITNALNNALLLAASEFRVDDILGTNQAAFRERVQQRVRELIDGEHLGVSIEQVDVQPSPPLYLRSRFSEVDQTMLKRDKMINQANSYATSNVFWAQGEATNRVLVADAARKRKVDLMAAQADTFKKLLAQYERDPELFKRIRQMTVLQTIYTNAQDKIMVPPNSRELRFQLNREPQEPSVSNIPTTP
jgi:membrane protease subunit HflK